MTWTAPFIIYRINEQAHFEEVFHTADMKKAKYWLTYIAKPGDVLCRTPAHAKLALSKTPEYFQHKDAKGQLSSLADGWKTFAKSKNCEAPFPSDQVQAWTEGSDG